MTPDPYNRIMEAAKLGKGVNLSPKEVAAMAVDSGIQRRAESFKADRAVWYMQEMWGALKQYRYQKAAGIVSSDPLGSKRISEALGKE